MLSARGAGWSGSGFSGGTGGERVLILQHPDQPSGTTLATPQVTLPRPGDSGAVNGAAMDPTATAADVLTILSAHTQLRGQSLQGRKGAGQCFSGSVFLAYSVAEKFLFDFVDKY